MKDDTAMLLDAEQEGAQFVMYDGELETLRFYLKCNEVDFGILDKGVGLFTASETESEIGFMLTYKGVEVMFRGNGMLVGDDKGNPAPLDIVPSDLKIQMLKFTKINETNAEEKEEGV